MDAITEQVKFLHRHGIDNDVQLVDTREDTERQIAALTTEHKALSNEKRRVSVPEERRAQLGAQISALSGRIKTLRKDIKLCDAVLERAVVIAEKQAQLNQQNKDNNEKGTINKRKHYR